MTRNLLCLHTGARQVSAEELAALPVPPNTETYCTVPHVTFIDQILSAAQRLLVSTGYTYSGSAIAVQDREELPAARMFACFRYEQPGVDDMALSIGLRNSYDKSMSAGICIGAVVFVCDNLAFNGEVTYMRRHTKNVLEDLRKNIVATLFNAGDRFQGVLTDARMMKSIAWPQNRGFETIGLLEGHGIFKGGFCDDIREEWMKPSLPEFAPRNLWSFYNTCTLKMRELPINTIMEKHVALHHFLSYPVRGEPFPETSPVLPEPLLIEAETQN